ncbi:hypothetical protein A0H81_09385 [Grifola frondosa]|uniref:Protein kinase domain-containing protein n=1 Tax=Grifola frondosa TaxID=5627 RepID=A0A1C7M112_GRIFR|nr:hypothetical protein A0H81_09385 [Grifola frondosa]
MAMPFLRRYNDPRFWTVGEVIEFFRQIFEGLQFMHEHHNRTLTGAAKQRSRAAAPTKYLYIDFGLSRRYSPEENNPLAVPILGGDRTVPEFQDDELTPRNPFHTDIYYIGNLIREDFLDKYSNLEFMRPLVDVMVTKDAGARPKIDKVVVQFDEIQWGLKYWKLLVFVLSKMMNASSCPYSTMILRRITEFVWIPVSGFNIITSYHHVWQSWPQVTGLRREGDEDCVFSPPSSVGPRA